MAEVGTSDLPSITHPQSPALSSQSESPKVDTEKTEIETQLSTDDNEPQEPQLTSPGRAVEQDDEVQFIFSAPRRRKKKRKIFEASHGNSDAVRGSEVAAKSPTTPSPAKSPRRVSASKSETLQIGTVKRHDITSIPSVPPNINMNPGIRSSSFTSSDTHSSASSPGWIPSWRSEPSPLLSSYDAQHNWIPIPNKNNYAMKRKWEEVHEIGRPCPPTQSWASPPSDTDDLDVLGRLNSTSGVSWDTSNVQPSFTNWSIYPAVLPWQNCDGGDRTSSEGTPLSLPCPFPATNARKQTVVGDFQPDPSTFPPTSMQRPVQRLSLQDSNADQQSIQVPVSQLPDQSVSPRTKTVQIFKPSSLEFVHQCPIPYPFPSPSSPDVLVGGHDQQTEHPVCQPRSPQDFTPLSISNPITFQPSPTFPSDLRRKPSLYKIPPWIPPNAAGVLLSNSLSASMNSSRREGGTHGKPRDDGSANTKTPSLVNFTQSTAAKHSPNLIVDIAETCQQNFPFAAVAERHKQPIQKVFDTFSSIIQIPLLRHASDNRRNGSLGKKRMKEFRDAKRAMNKSQEEERRNLKDPAQVQPSLKDAGKPLKAKKGQGLLKAAILNNAREKKGNAA